MNSDSKKLLKQIVKQEIKIVSEQKAEFPWTGSSKKTWDLLTSWGAVKQAGGQYAETVLTLKLPWWWAPPKKPSGTKGPVNPKLGFSYPAGSTKGLIETTGDILTFKPNAVVLSYNQPMINLAWKIVGNSIQLWSGLNNLGTITKGKKPGEGTYIESKESKTTRIEMKKEYQRWSAKEKKAREDVWWDSAQVAMDYAGFIPFYGDAIDLYNAWLYYHRDKPVDAVLTAIGAIPIIGSFINVGAKITIRLGTEVGAAIERAAKYGGKNVNEMWQKIFEKIDTDFKSITPFLANNIKNAMSPVFNVIKTTRANLKRLQVKTKTAANGTKYYVYVTKNGNEISAEDYKSMDDFCTYLETLFKSSGKSLDDIMNPLLKKNKWGAVWPKIKSANEAAAAADGAVDIFSKAVKEGPRMWTRISAALTPTIGKISNKMAIDLNIEMSKRFAKIVSKNGDHLYSMIRTAQLSTKGKAVLTGFLETVNGPAVRAGATRLADDLYAALDDTIKGQFFKRVEVTPATLDDAGRIIKPAVSQIQFHFDKLFNTTKGSKVGPSELNNFLTEIGEASKKYPELLNFRKSMDNLIKESINADNAIWIIWRSEELNILRTYATKPWALMTAGANKAAAAAYAEGTKMTAMAYGTKIITSIVGNITFAKAISNIWNELTYWIEKYAPTWSINTDDPDEKQSVVEIFLLPWMLEKTYTPVINKELEKADAELKQLQAQPGMQPIVKTVEYQLQSSTIDAYNPGLNAATK